ncbi:SDR family NAD(P)-dependent oxidoreductase [Acidocella sp.]|uniref:SDR family NAD(P)-dependent oxidoreductase n=1 Tax=Acidocella sp. TaxID=50710 RepID=UPI0026350729|nr:SDR family oxidoreductase [Acidocella sp.]
MSKGLFDLTGKVTLVTGGNSGIGFGFAMGVAKMGGDLEIWGRSAEKNAAAKAELEAAGAGRVVTRQVDVSKEDQIIAGYAALMAAHGRIDCVFANSGASAQANSFLTLTNEEYHSLIDLNLHGAYYTLREAAKLMVQRAEAGEPGGSLVACGSLSMFMGLPGKPHYAGSKAALGAIIRGMAVEFGKYAIRANIIAPGLISTGMTGDDQTPVAKFMGGKTPIPRVGYPADFEGIGAFLASDASSFVTGETITVDGGYMVRPM